MQNATTLPINDSPAFVATMKLLTASSPAACLWSLPFKDKLRVFRTLALAELQSRQKIKPYQQLRYWSTVPFHHGPNDVVKHWAAPSPETRRVPCKKATRRACRTSWYGLVNEDGKMSSFDFGVQFLDAEKMTYWGKRLDANFWIERECSWDEAEAPFHTIGRLTLLRN